MTDVLATLTTATAADDAALADLRVRLQEQAAEHSLLDVAFTTVGSPVGALLLAATQQGLVRVAFEIEGHDAVLAELSRRISPRLLRAPGRLEAAVRELEEYFAGRRRGFDLPVDLRLATGFRRQVLDRLQEVPFGRTASYTVLAQAAGSPRAVRAVGTACATNPLPLVIPCHRVVRSDGAIGSYRGGPAAKQVLLDLERAA